MCIRDRVWGRCRCPARVLYFVACRLLQARQCTAYLIPSTRRQLLRIPLGFLPVDICLRLSLIHISLNRSFIFVSTVCTFSPISVTLAANSLLLSLISLLLSPILVTLTVNCLFVCLISAFMSALLWSNASVRLTLCALIDVYKRQPLSSAQVSKVLIL